MRSGDILRSVDLINERIINRSPQSGGQPFSTDIDFHFIFQTIDGSAELNWEVVAWSLGRIAKFYRQNQRAGTSSTREDISSLTRVSENARLLTYCSAK
jgi:hypothetical protein